MKNYFNESNKSVRTRIITDNIINSERFNSFEKIQKFLDDSMYGIKFSLKLREDVVKLLKSQKATDLSIPRIKTLDDLLTKWV